MIMEYVEGMNLRDFLKLRVRLKDKEALPLMLGLAQGLKYSHEQGVTHRDIKATNILISNSGAAKLVDFGLATIEGDEQHGINSQRTVDYSALERTCKSPKGDPRSDIYFLGCVFYQMLTGQVPLEESESKDMLKKMLKRGLRRDQADQRAPRTPRTRPRADHREDDEDRPEGPLPDHGRGRRRPRRLSGHGRPGRGRRQANHARKYGPDAARGAEEEEELVFLSRRRDCSRPMGRPRPATPGQPRSRRLRAAKNVLCVEAQAEIQDALRKNLSRMGYRVLLVGDAERAAERYREAPTDAVIFDVDGLGPEAIERSATCTRRPRRTSTAGRPGPARPAAGCASRRSSRTTTGSSCSPSRSR